VGFAPFFFRPPYERPPQIVSPPTCVLLVRRVHRATKSDTFSRRHFAYRPLFDWISTATSLRIVIIRPGRDHIYYTRAIRSAERNNWPACAHAFVLIYSLFTLWRVLHRIVYICIYICVYYTHRHTRARVYRVAQLPIYPEQRQQNCRTRDDGASTIILLNEIGLSGGASLGRVCGGEAESNFVSSRTRFSITIGMKYVQRWCRRFHSRKTQLNRRFSKPTSPK